MNWKTGPMIATAILLMSASAHAEGDPKKSERVFNKCKACYMVG